MIFWPTVLYEPIVSSSVVPKWCLKGYLLAVSAVPTLGSQCIINGFGGKLCPSWIVPFLLLNSILILFLHVAYNFFIFFFNVSLLQLKLSNTNSKFLTLLWQVGEDEFGYMLADILKQNNVDNSGMRFDHNARTSLAFVTLRADGEREFLFFRHPSADMLLHESELDIDLIKQVSPFEFYNKEITKVTDSTTDDYFCRKFYIQITYNCRQGSSIMVQLVWLMNHADQPILLRWALPESLVASSPMIQTWDCHYGHRQRLLGRA